MRLEEESYWMVTGEWLQVVEVEESSIVIPGRQSLPKVQLTRVVKMETINQNPAMYAIVMNGKRINYAIINQIALSKDAYDKIAQAGIAAKASQNGTGEIKEIENEQ